MPQFRNVYGALAGADALTKILTQRKAEELTAIEEEEKRRQLAFENQMKEQDYDLRKRTVGVAEGRLRLEENTPNAQDLIWVNDPDNPGAQKLVPKAQGLVNPPDPRKPEALTDLGEAFVDYAEEKYGDRNHPLTFADKEAAKKRWEATNDRPVDPLISVVRDLTAQNLERNLSGEITPGQYSMAGRLRDDFRVESKDFLTQETQYRKIKSIAVKPPTGAGDMSLVFAYMKMLDPPSVVREGEQRDARNTTGVPDYVMNLYNRLITGQRLTPTQRADFISAASSLYQSALPDQQRRVENYREQAIGLNLPEKFILKDPDPDLVNPQTSVGGYIVTPKSSGTAAPPLNVGGYQVRPKQR